MNNADSKSYYEVFKEECFSMLFIKRILSLSTKLNGVTSLLEHVDLSDPILFCNNEFALKIQF
jgi:hypothetical protein